MTSMTTSITANHSIHHFRRLFEYETWAGERVLESFQRAKHHLEHDASAVAAEASPFVRAIEIDAHVQAARRLWLCRVDPGLLDPPDAGLFPVWDLDRVTHEHRTLDKAWSARLMIADDLELSRTVSYTTTEGVASSTALHDILTHVITHSSYHRGQIARLVAECGVQPAITDFIFFARSQA